MTTANDMKPMTTGQWFLTLLVLSIPIVNIILYIVWAAGAGNVNRVTFCRASILWFLIVMVIGFLVMLLTTGGAMMLGA